MTESRVTIPVFATLKMVVFLYIFVKKTLKTLAQSDKQKKHQRFAHKQT